MPSRQSILANAFHPGTELDDPELFAGRRAQVLELTKALHSDGSCPIVYGDRGLGKSSLALQVQRIAMGDPSLLELQDADPDYQDDDPRLGLHAEDDYSPPWAFKEDDSYLAFYIACSDSTSDTNAILQRLINSLTSVGPYTSSSASQLVDRTTRKRITVKLFELESTRNYRVPEPSSDYAELTIEEKLQAAAQRLVAAYGHRIILIVDELDRVRDTSGLASFIKIASSHDLKFLLVGIAQNVSNMLSDHQSIERMAVPVEVPRMNKHELGQIVERAMRKLRDQGITFKFESDAKAELAKVASGFPWFVHLLGQKALLKAEEEGKDTVTRFHVAIAIRSLIDNRLAQQFSDLYQAAVRDSQMRETVMRALAHWIGRDIPYSGSLSGYSATRSISSFNIYKPSLQRNLRSYSTSTSFPRTRHRALR